MVERASSPYIPAFLISYSDSSFTNPHQVVLPDNPPDCTGDFTHMGAKYWGLETKRHCANGTLVDDDAYYFDHEAHHWFVIGLKNRSVVDWMTVSTKWFTGNQVPAISVFLFDEMTGQEIQVLDREPLNPDAEHSFEIPFVTATEVRVDIYHEGGIARVNCFGVETEEQIPDRENKLLDARITHVSNEHYGKPSDAVAGEREVMHMFGWESARGGYGERALFHFPREVAVDTLVVDTYMHRLNPPLACHAFGLRLQEGESVDEMMERMPRYKIIFDNGKEVIPEDLKTYMNGKQYLQEEGVDNPHQFRIIPEFIQGGPWLPIVPFGRLEPDTYHRFPAMVEGIVITHLLYMHYPHGGIHGLKLFGKWVE